MDPAALPPRAPSGDFAPGGKLPRDVVVLGVVSLLTDVSSEMIFAVLPLFVTGVLGASPVTLGLMEGLADFAGSALDMASGHVSDRTGWRRPIAAAGYGLSTLAKALLVLASTVGQVFAFRVVERLGKSIRGAPRDALLAAIAPARRRGFAFGLHKALDKTGAIVGPLVAYLVLARLGAASHAYRVLFGLALVPAVLSLVLLVLGVRERRGRVRDGLRLRHTLATLGPGYRRYLASAALFSLAYFSFAFLLLAAGRAGFAAADVALLYALFNGAFALVSVPIGTLGDRIGRRALVALSYALYAAMAAGFALVHSRAGVVALFVVYGVFYAIDEGQTRAYVADLVDADTRATAIGLYGFVTGLVYLPASLVAGALWKLWGPPAAFLYAAATAAAACGVFLATAPRTAR